MARLARYTQKTFGTNAGINQMAQYGSFAAGTPSTYSGATITPTIVQSLTNFLEGWYSAVEGAYSPAIEDMNALFYLAFFQLAYLNQTGVSEWDSGTTYYTGCLVQSSGVMYVSIIDTNLNQAITDSTKWFTPTQYGALLQQTLNGSMTLPAGKTMMWSMMPVVSSQTIVVPSGARLVNEGVLNVSGTGVVQATGTGVVRGF